MKGTKIYDNKFRLGDKIATGGFATIHLAEKATPEELSGKLVVKIAKIEDRKGINASVYNCLLYTSPSPRDGLLSRMPSSA